MRDTVKLKSYVRTKDPEDVDDVWRVTAVLSVNCDIESTTRPGVNYRINMTAVYKVESDVPAPPVKLVPFTPTEHFELGTVVTVKAEMQPSKFKRSYVVDQRFAVIGSSTGGRYRIAKLGGDGDVYWRFVSRELERVEI